MSKKWIHVLFLLLALLMLAGCGSIAPKEKTIILAEEAVQQEADDESQSAQSFEVKKITQLPLDKLNPSGIHPDVNKAVTGWIDADNLAAMSVQTVEIAGDQLPEMEVEQPTERVMTQFVRMNYQYGFYDPILTLADVEAECFDISSDGSLVAYVAGNTMDVYSLHSGTRVQTQTRQVLASRVTFVQDGHDVFFTAAGDEKQLERLNADTGVLDSLMSGKSYRVLAAAQKGMIVCTQADGAESIGYWNENGLKEDLLSNGARSNSHCILPTGEGLVAYDEDLYLLNAQGAQRAGDGVLAFDLASDGMHIAYAQSNDDGTVDIRIGYWGGSRVINDKLTYKDIGIRVNAMYFSPDMRKLYLQGLNESGALAAYTFEFQ